VYGHGIRISDYWIEEFLDSEFLTTAAAGTKRLAVALRDAARKSEDVNVKSEIAAAVTLAGKLAGRRINIDQFCVESGLTNRSINAVKREIDFPALLQDNFKFDLNEFRAQVPFRTMELDNGALLTADADEFTKIFETEVLNKAKRTVKVTTRGAITDEKIGKSRSR